MSLGIKIPRNALSAGREAFKNNPNGGENVSLEPGEYMGLIKAIKGVETQKGPQIVCDITVGGEDVDSSVKGGTVSLWFSFEEERVVFLFKFLALLGYSDKLDDLSTADLEEIADEVPGRNIVVKFRATEKDGFTNIRLKKVMEDLTPEDIGLEENSAKKKKSKKTDDDDADETPKKKKAVEDDDGDEPPKKKKKVEDDDEDETPKKKKKSSDDGDDDDADEKPKKKSKKTDDDDDAEKVSGDDDNIEVKVGLKANATIKGEDRVVKVTKLLPDEEKIIVQDLETEEKFKITPDRLF